MYAVIASGGKQYKVSNGDVINVELLKKEAGDIVAFDVLAVSGNGKTVIGKPTVDGAVVEGKVLENGKAKKVVIYKYKAKKDYRKKIGHRQPYTQVEITNIAYGDMKAEAPKKEEAAAEKKPSLKSMKKAELIEFAKENNIEIDETATNAELIASIEAGLK